MTNNQDNLQTNDQCNIPIYDQSYPSNDRINELYDLRFFYINLNNYSEDKTENCFLTFNRKPYSLCSLIDARSSIPNSTDSLSSVLQKANNDEVNQKSEIKPSYLAHLYDETPKTYNIQYFRDQLTCYMRSQNDSLTHIKGFSIINLNGLDLPIAIAERPSNGPLSSLFSTLKINQAKSLTYDRDDKGQIIYSKSMKIDTIKTVTAEQKYMMIVGIVNGISYIHTNGFIHSNLNPTTVYLDDQLQTQICDYVYAPLFEIQKDIQKKDTFYYQIEGNEEKFYETFKNDVYVSPEIKKGKKFDQSSDIYSIGMIMFYILAEKEAEIPDHSIENYPKNFPIKWKKIIDKCISIDPKNRWSSLELINMLLDDKNVQELVSLISSSPSEISQNTNLRLTIIKSIVHNKFQNVKPAIEIFHKMIPNINEIDDEIKLLITAAEKGDVKSIEKVGDFFYTGDHNIYKDDEWACECYEHAARKGSLYSMLKYAEFKEKGIGTDVDLNQSLLFYNRIVKIINSKRKEIDNKRKTLIIKDVPSNESEESIREVLEDIKIESFETTDSKSGDKKQMTLKIAESDYIDNAVELIKDNKDLQCEIFHKKEVQTHRFDSLVKDLPRLNLNDFDIVQEDEQFKTLGSGSYGDTYAVFKKETNEQFAAKIYNSFDDDLVNGLKREILMASKFNHPAILQYIGFNEHSLLNFVNKENMNEILPTLFMKKIMGGNLEEAIAEGEIKWDDTKKMIVIIGIASGLSEMYKHQIIHRDLKPGNILLTEDFEPVICDLGSSRQYSEKLNEEKSKEFGTPIFAAAETFDPNFHPIYKCEIDSYSFGIIIYQVLTLTKSNNVYPGINAVNIAIKKLNENHPKPPDDLNKVLKNLILACWCSQIDDRPKPPEIYDILVKAVVEQNPLLPNIDTEKVIEYIKKIDQNFNNEENGDDCCSNKK